MTDERFNGPFRVVVVDDDPEMVKAIEVILKTAGIEVLAAHSGLTGLMLVKRELPEAVILDIMMPDIDGYEVCRKLKLNPETMDIPIIFVTARTGQQHIERGLSLGAQGYITKPFRSRDLIDKLAEVTGRSA